jgi:hypothetical protein
MSIEASCVTNTIAIHFNYHKMTKYTNYVIGLVPFVGHAIAHGYAA